MRIQWNTSWITDYSQKGISYFKEIISPLKGLTWKDILVRGVDYVKSLTRKQRIIAGLVAGSILIGGTVLTTHYVTNLNTIYRVYVDGKEIGVISNGNDLENWLDEQLNTQVKKYPQLLVHFDKKVYYKEDSEYKGVTNNKAVFDYLNKNVHMVAKAEALVVDGKVLAYATDEKAIDNTINYIKSLYSGKPANRPDGVLTASTSNQPVTGQSTSLPGDPYVTIKENVQTVATNISPDQVLNNDQLLQLLQKGELEPKKYTVQAGDTISTIAKKFSIKQSQLISMNPQISSGVIKPGQVLNVEALTPKLTILSTSQEDATEVMAAPVEVRSDSSLYKGDEKVISSGTDGKRQVKYFVVKENGNVINKQVLKEVVINQPSKRIIVRGTKVKSDRGTGLFRMPAFGYISSGYGYRGSEFHKGIDIAGGGYGSPIVAADNGRVISAGWNGGYGNCIIIDHGNGFRTLYGHMSSLNVSVGKVVQRGELIGKKGSTGQSTGVHLHFEVHKNGAVVNPMSYLR